MISGGSGFNKTPPINLEGTRENIFKTRNLNKQNCVKQQQLFDIILY